MTIANQFEYARPETIDEAVAVLSEAGEGGIVLAGGTDVVGWLRDELMAPRVLIDIKGIEGLNKIAFENDTLSIGALVTFAELIESNPVREKFPLIVEAARMVASAGIRNRATLVGNICSAVPSCDGGPPLLVYEAEVQIQGPESKLSIPIVDWFAGPKRTAIKRGEIVTSISLPVSRRRCGTCYVKLGRYRGEDLAQAGVAILAREDCVYRVAFGAVAPTPVRAWKIEAELDGKPLDDGLVKACQGLVAKEISPITDIRSTKEYRLHMAQVMLERGLRASVARLEGREPPIGENLI